MKRLGINPDASPEAILDAARAKHPDFSEFMNALMRTASSSQAGSPVESREPDTAATLEKLARVESHYDLDFLNAEEHEDPVLIEPLFRA